MADDGTGDATSGSTVLNTNGAGKSDADADQRGRTIQDHTGRTWTVSEKQLATDSDSAPSLLFVSDYSIRRVRDYPRNWFELSDADLFEVSLNR